MSTPLPLHRRARTWYGQRLGPTEPFRLPPTELRDRVPALYLAPLAADVRQAPVDRRLTDLL
jgi:hypothetical protein